MDNSNIAKKGYLEGFLRSIGPSRKWQRRYYVLYHSSIQCQPRLDYYPDESSFLGDKAVRKTIYIEEIKSIKRHQEEGKPNCLHITTDSQKDHILSAASKAEATQWYNAMRDIRERLNRDSDMMSLATDDDDDDDIIDENMCYDTLTRCHSFDVVVQQTEAADRCNISEKQFNLVIAQQHMALISNDDAATMYSWQFSHIRRYGRNKLTFLFEAGRKCPSGPGMFILRTKEGQKIFQEIRSYTKNMRSQSKGDTPKPKSPVPPPVPKHNTMEPPEYQEPGLPKRGYRVGNSYKQNLPPAMPSTSPPRKLNIPAGLTKELHSKLKDQKRPSTPPAKAKMIYPKPGPNSPDLVASLGKVRLVNDQPTEQYTSVYEAQRLDPEYSPAGPLVNHAPVSSGEHEYALYDYTASTRFSSGATANFEPPNPGRPTASLLATLRGKQKVTDTPEVEEDYAHLNISATPFSSRSSGPRGPQQRALPQPISDNQYELTRDFEEPPETMDDHLYDEVGARG